MPIVSTLRDFPTDIGHFPESLDSKDKRYIVSMGSCKPTGPFPRNTKDNRCFTTGYYVCKTKSGLELPRTWLCYSPQLNVAYCEPCWLFASLTWKTNNWQNLSRKIHQHETSTAHTAACVVYDHWRQNRTIDTDMERDILHEASFWRQVLHRVINVTLTLAVNNIPFRGHREKVGEINSGNFLSIIELLAKYDPVLEDLISRPARSIKYLSPLIQNELIELLAKHVQKDIIDGIRSAPFFSVIMDTTQDVAKVDQMSQIYRYVIIERDARGVACDIKIKE